MNSDFKIKALNWANQFEVFCFLDSHKYVDKYGRYDWILAIGEDKSIQADHNFFKELEEFQLKNPAFMFGFFSYDLKNQIESLHSKNPDHLQFPLGYFFIPKFLIASKNNQIEIILNPETTFNLISEINNFKPSLENTHQNINVKPKITKEAYLNKVQSLKEHIAKGDIYEVTFCQEFYASDTSINPINTYLDLTHISPVPFGSLFRYHSKYILSASPERFIQKNDSIVISQPIKGTISRSNEPEKDNLLKNKLKNDPKEIAENIMIVDLVRNDLTKIAKKGSVGVAELCEIYSFPNVHQMISTITCEVEKETSSVSIIKNCFPMGSMTGAPKIKAMELIEKYEASKRGVFSGSIGYFEPNGNFDFNVLIRSIFYNKENKYLSFQVGGAITHHSEPELEYAECLLKASNILHILNA